MSEARASNSFARAGTDTFGSGDFAAVWYAVTRCAVVQVKQAVAPEQLQGELVIPLGVLAPRVHAPADLLDAGGVLLRVIHVAKVLHRRLGQGRGRERPPAAGRLRRQALRESQHADQQNQRQRCQGKCSLTLSSLFFMAVPQVNPKRSTRSRRSYRTGNVSSIAVPRSARVAGVRPSMLRFRSSRLSG